MGHQIAEVDRVNRDLLGCSVVEWVVNQLPGEDFCGQALAVGELDSAIEAELIALLEDVASIVEDRLEAVIKGQAVLGLKTGHTRGVEALHGGGVIKKQEQVDGPRFGDGNRRLGPNRWTVVVDVDRGWVAGGSLFVLDGVLDRGWVCDETRLGGEGDVAIDGVHAPGALARNHKRLARIRRSFNLDRARHQPGIDVGVVGDHADGAALTGGQPAEVVIARPGIVVGSLNRDGEHSDVSESTVVIQHGVVEEFGEPVTHVQSFHRRVAVVHHVGETAVGIDQQAAVLPLNGTANAAGRARTFHGAGADGGDRSLAG